MRATIRALALVLALTGEACAVDVGWDTRIDCYAGRPVTNGVEYAFGNHGGVMSFSYWNTNSIGKPSPSAETLASDDDAVRRWVEEYPQTLKPFDVKAAENGFLLVCQSLTGSRTKLSFGDIRLLIEDMKATNFQAAADLSISLLSIDSELKRECGEKWWNSCVWHPEIVNQVKERNAKRLKELKRGAK